MNLFKEIRILKEKGKLHAKLISRTRMLFIIATILFFAVSYNVTLRDVSSLAALVIGAIGFLLGLFVFSKMSVVDWNEAEALVQVGKMDKVGYISIALYIVFEITLRTVLKTYFPSAVIPLLLAGICGTILGRAIGTLVEIHRVYSQNK